jgi:hypothetical protein
LNTPRKASTRRRTAFERLEPDFNRGVLPAGVVYHPEFGGGLGNQALWDVWTEENFEADGGRRCPIRQEPGGWHHRLPADAGRDNPATLLRGHPPAYRIVTATRRRNEDGDMYDLTRVFIEEARFHPFAPHDDLIDAVSRVFDMEPTKPVPFEAMRADPTIYKDS